MGNLDEPWTSASKRSCYSRNPSHAISVSSGSHCTGRGEKTVSDAWNGYHSVPLQPEDRHFTTFITPLGRYRYCSAPQGYIASGDAYTRRFDEVAAEFPNKIKVIDDALLWHNSLEESFFQAARWLDLCGKNGITQNPNKFVLGADTGEFSGFKITLTEVQPSDDILRAIRDFPKPKNITDIRSWFGLINQVAYTFSMASHMQPFRDLLKPKSTFYWDETLQKLFEESKETIIEEKETAFISSTSPKQPV